jgi:hypothetical protein
LTLKPRPTRTAQSSSQRSRPLSAARVTATAPSSSTIASTPSTMLLRPATTLIGLMASSSAAVSPAARPQARPTSW